MLRRSIDLWLVLGLAAVQAALSAAPSFPGDVILRVVVGIPMALLAPGYAVLAATWPHGALRSGERVALSMGASLALAALGGLVLYWSGLRLAQLSWTVLLSVVAALGSLVGIVRRADESDYAPLARTRRSWGAPALGLFAVSGIVVFGAVGFAVLSASRPREQFSELWLVQPPSSATIQVGLRNMEVGPTRFHVQVLAGDTVTLDEADIELATGQTWQRSLELHHGRSDTDSIRAFVYRADDPETPYRRVELRPPQKG
jgi:uncharacterized membrane protein